MPLLDRSTLGQVARRRVVDPGEQLGQRGEGVRSGSLGEGVLVVQAPVGVLERGAHRQDRLAVLDGVHPAGRERAAVAHALDAEGDRLRVVAGAHEVGVQRVQSAVLPALDGAHRPAAGDDALGEHLTTEHPSVRLLLALPAKQRDVLGEGLGQRDRKLAVRRPGGRHRLHAHDGRPQLLEVEGGEEVDDRGGLGRGHRRNDIRRVPGGLTRRGRTQATSGRLRPLASGRLVPPAANVPDAREGVRAASRAVARRPTASTITSGGST